MIKNYKKNLKILEDNYVYSKEMEHDACGVGLVASTDGKKLRKIVEYGIEALKAVWHRGAVDADGKTGDGAGIHVEIPYDFFEEKIETKGHKHDDSEICVGMIFLPRDNFNVQENCKSIIEKELTKSNFKIYGWRQVPINTKVLGDKANSNRPEITQILFKHNDKKLVDKDLERKLYEIRRKIENEIIKNNIEGFYICSLSSKSIIYKGMFLAEALSDFYPDLNDERFISRYAIFHQRFSTNTFPSWDLAQPFRAIAHNGEINTFRGNCNWMKVHQDEMESPLFENIENLKPVIQPGASDSAALDNVFELLNISGQSAPLAKLMLIPDAWSKKSKILPRDHQRLFNFLNSTMEPWDGPAAIAATDNEWAIVANDRNGLRPLRYTITNDKLLFAGSETGMIDLDEKKIVSKGRLGPGEIIGIRINKGKVFDNNEIKNYLAKEFKHFNSQIVDLDKKITIDKEKFIFSGTDLRKRQHAFGISIEDLDYWVERTKNLEDKLSDRLHEELTKSFIDKRASVLARGLKQDITFKTEIMENKNVLINNQFIGQLNGLKLELDFKVGALDTDIKSLKKAAKQNVEPEILNRMRQIKETCLIELKDDFKVYWKNFPIAKLSPGKDYLRPEINLIIDDMIDGNDKSDFSKFIQNWINKKINTELKSLTDLKNINTSNSSIRALAYQLYENNGVIKRDNVKDFLKKLAQEERKVLRNLGVKFGRYHIFLFKLFKPNAVSLRIALWKNFHQKYFNLKPPTFGLNFVKESKEYSNDFMLLCGFEKFDNFFVRIDILERLFIKIIDLKNEKDIKLVPEMLNLLGCSKEDFLKLIKKMNYYSYEKDQETYFRYSPTKNTKKQFSSKILKKENAFSVLKNINFK